MFFALNICTKLSQGCKNFAWDKKGSFIWEPNVHNTKDCVSFMPITPFCNGKALSCTVLWMTCDSSLLFFSLLMHNNMLTYVWTSCYMQDIWLRWFPVIFTRNKTTSWYNVKLILVLLYCYHVYCPTNHSQLLITLTLRFPANER